MTKSANFVIAYPRVAANINKFKNPPGTVFICVSPLTLKDGTSLPKLSMSRIKLDARHLD